MTTVTEETLSVSEVARDSGVAPSAVRFYEKHGLITGQRTAGNQRRFHRVEPCLVKIVRVAQRVGLTVAEIRDLMADLPQDRSEMTLDAFYHLRARLEDEAHAAPPRPHRDVGRADLRAEAV